jgi:hypothetical protein
MSIPDDADPELLIERLGGPLPPSARAAFRRAALDALTRVPCLGEGAIYRAVAALQRAYFSPPDTRYDSRRDDVRNNKLTSGPPIGADDPRTGGRDRRRLKLVG